MLIGVLIDGVFEIYYILKRRCTSDHVVDRTLAASVVSSSCSVNSCRLYSWAALRGVYLGAMAAC